MTPSLVLSFLCVLLAVPSTATANTATGYAAAVAACKTLNISLKLDLMHGFGPIDGYSRNSGCGYLCGRKVRKVYSFFGGGGIFIFALLCLVGYGVRACVRVCLRVCVRMYVFVRV